MEFVDKEKMCRLCLLGSESLICIFEMNNLHGYVAAEVIEDLLQLNVSKEDDYPHQVCSLCLTKLTDFKLFKEQCQTSKLTYDNVFSPNESHVDYCPQSNMIQIMSVKDEPLEREYEDEDNQARDTTCFNDGPSRHEGSNKQSGEPDKDRSGALENEEDGDRARGEILAGDMTADGQETSIDEQETDLRITFTHQYTSNEEEGKSKKDHKEKRFSRQECGTSFEYHKKLVHHQYTHNAEKPFKCHLCEKRFNRRGSLVLHLRTHTGEKPYSCRECGKGFSQKYSMVMHLRNHSGQKPYPCDECPKSFNTRCDLKRHKKTHSQEEKPTDCATCGERFVSNAELRKHEAMHTGGKVYTCDWCGKVFIQRKSLVIHLRSHTGERPFQCRECGKGFARKYSLDLHCRIHERVRPYPCDECNKRFNSASHLKRHKRQHNSSVEEMTEQQEGLETTGVVVS